MFVKIRLFCFQIFQEKETRVNILKQIMIDFIIIIIIIVILQFYFCIFSRYYYPFFIIVILLYFSFLLCNTIYVNRM